MTKSPLKRVAPTIVKRTVTMPIRNPNSVYRTREHLTGAEVDRLIDAAKANRWGHRDATMILVAFRHGLWSSELVDLRWDQIDFARLPPIPCPRPARPSSASGGPFASDSCPRAYHCESPTAFSRLRCW